MEVARLEVDTGYRAGYTEHMSQRRASTIRPGDYVEGYGTAEHAAYVPAKYRRSMAPAYVRSHVWVTFNGVMREFNRNTSLTFRD